MKLTTALLMSSCLLQGATPGERTTVATGEGYFPVLIQLKNGNLMGVFRGGAPHVGVGGRLDTVTSTDNGRTWSKPKTVIDGPEDDRNPAFGQLQNGDLILAFSVLRGYDATGLHLTAKKRSDRVIDGVYLMRSTDGGGTWSKPERSEPIHELQKGGATISSFGKLVQLRDGTVLMSVYCEFWDGRGNRAFVVRSHDNGKTWGDISLVGQDVNETALLGLPDGTLLAALRSVTTGHLSTSLSRDAGQTWSASVLLTKDMEHPADLISLKNGDVLLTYGVRNAPFGVAAVLSHDGGKTWDKEHKISLADDTGNIDSGYPSSVQLRDGRIVTMYYQVDDPANTPVSAKSKVVIWTIGGKN